MDVQVSKVFKDHWLGEPQSNPKYAKFPFVWNILLIVVITANVFRVFFDKLDGDYSFKNMSHVFKLEVIVMFENMLFFAALLIVSVICLLIVEFFTAEEIGVTPAEVYRKTRLSRQKIPLSDIRLVKNNAVWLTFKTDKDDFNWGKSFYNAEKDEIVAYILEQINIYYPEKYEDVKSEHYEVEKFWRE